MIEVWCDDYSEDIYDESWALESVAEETQATTELTELLWTENGSMPRQWDWEYN
jgi:hypothetical protein